MPNEFQELSEQVEIILRQPINEMANLGVVDDLTIKINSDDHSPMHVHYGKYRISIENEIKNGTDVINACIDKEKPNDKLASDFADWINKPYKHNNNQTNREFAITLWKTWHDEQSNL